MTDTILIPHPDELNDILNEALREQRPQVIEAGRRRFAVSVEPDNDGWHVATDMTMPEGTCVWAWDTPRGYTPLLGDTVREVIAEHLREMPGGAARRRSVILDYVSRFMPDDEVEEVERELDEIYADLIEDGMGAVVEALEDYIVDLVQEPATEAEIELLEVVLDATGKPYVLEYGDGFNQGEAYYALVFGDPEVERPFARYLIQAARGEVYGVRVALLDEAGRVEAEESMWGLVGDDFIANDGVEFVIGTIVDWLE